MIDAKPRELICTTNGGKLGGSTSSSGDFVSLDSEPASASNLNSGGGWQRALASSSGTKIYLLSI